MENIDFEKKTLNILEIFRLSLIKAIAISELKKEMLDKSGLEGFNREIEVLDKSVGVESVARSQAVVIMITSLEVFFRDFFSIMVTREDLTKKALRECENIKLNSKELLNLINSKSSWGDIIIKKENLNFQNYGSLIKSFKILNIELEDILEDTVKEVNDLLDKDNVDKKRRISEVNGEELLKGLIDMRHRVIHQSENFKISEIDFDNYLLFLSFLAPKIRNVFFPTEVKYIYKKFTYNELQ